MVGDGWIYAWADDPCDITTSVVEMLEPQSVLQVVGSADHLLSFLTAPSVTTIAGFDIDERALAFAELKLSAAKLLDYDTACRFFNMSRYRRLVCGDLDHPVFDPSLAMNGNELTGIWEAIAGEMSTAARAVIEPLLDRGQGFDRLAAVGGSRRLASATVLPWLERERYARLRDKVGGVSLFEASLDPRYGAFAGDVADGRFDLLWPLNALDHGVDVLAFLNFLISTSKGDGHVMLHFGIKDPYVSLGDALTDIVNLPDAVYAERVGATRGQPAWVVSFRDLLEELGFRFEEELVAEIGERYFPRRENVWWDDDLRQAWTPGRDAGVGDVFQVYRGSESLERLTPEAFGELVRSLPKHFRRGLLHQS